MNATDPNTSKYRVRITEGESELYTGQTVSMISAMTLAALSCMQQGVFSMSPESVTESDDFTHLRIAFNGRTLDAFIESEHRLQQIEADKKAFEDLTAGFDSGPTATA